MNKYLYNTIYNIFAVILAFVILLVSVFCVGLIIDSHDKITYQETRSYTVHAADTLWDIALNVKFEDQDVRDVMDDIKRINACGDSLQAGQILQLPMYERG